MTSPQFQKKHAHPAPAEIRAAREQAGLTQLQAARLAGYGHQQRWAEIETGVRRIDPWRWSMFMHRAGIRRLPFGQSDT